MKFWDSSAIVPLLMAEASSRSVRQMYRDDPHMIAWWGSELECASAIARRLREKVVPEAIARDALDRLLVLRRSWQEIEPGDELRESAKRFVRVHPLRAGDALQLAAAFRAAEGRPTTLPFISLDERLAAAAQREGFQMVVPS